MLINGNNYYFVNKEKDICVENIEDALNSFKCPSMCIDCNLGLDKCDINYVNNYPIECAKLMGYEIIAEKDLPEKYLLEKYLPEKYKNKINYNKNSNQNKISVDNTYINYKDLLESINEYPVAESHSNRVSQILTKILEAGDKAVTAKEIAEDYNKNYNRNYNGVNIQNSNSNIPKICQILNIEPYVKFNINIGTYQHPNYGSNFYWFDNRGKIHIDTELENKVVNFKQLNNTINYLIENNDENIIKVIEEKEKEENILTSKDWEFLDMHEGNYLAFEFDRINVLTKVFLFINKPRYINAFWGDYSFRYEGKELFTGIKKPELKNYLLLKLNKEKRTCKEIEPKTI